MPSSLTANVAVIFLDNGADTPMPRAIGSDQERPVDAPVCNGRPILAPSHRQARFFM